jgi:DNA-binding NtrC family response regulator
MRGEELLAVLRARYATTPVLITTAFGSIESAVDAIKAGAHHYLSKPFRIEHLLAAVEQSVRERRLERELSRLEQTPPDARSPIVARSPAMRGAVDVVLKAAFADTPVLLEGESGTGKELLARELHVRSPRCHRPFVPVNCSAIPETLLESQLFGHRRGSFTDAREDRKGLLQEAEGGTVFLDEIGDMLPSLQAKILRVLQEKEVHPVGAASPVPIDVRIVAATHRTLSKEIERGSFREDLYYRLNVISVRVPPLRERPEDLLPLIAHFLDKHGRRLGRTGCTVAPEALDLLRSHTWPGNVRELENWIERALVLGEAKRITAADLPLRLRGPNGEDRRARDILSLAQVERDHILRALGATQGNKAAAARLLRMDRKTLYRKLGHIED